MAASTPIASTDAELDAKVAALLPLEPDDYQALLHARTIRTIGGISNITETMLDFAHDKVPSLEAQETFTLLTDLAYAALYRAADSPTEPLPKEQLDQLRAVLGALPAGESA